MSTSPFAEVDAQTQAQMPVACVRVPLRKQDGSLAGYALIDEQDASLAELRWHLGSGGYARRLEKGKWTFMHRVIMQAPAGFEVDHINRNRLDNRRCNLRLTDRGGNARNCKRNRRNTSGYKGVHRVGQGGRWAAVIKYEGETFHLGVCATAEEAAVTYDLAAMALHGEFAAPNFSYAEPLPMLGELRELLLWFIGKRLCWHRPFDKLRDRLRPVNGNGGMYVVPCSGPKARRYDLIQRIVDSAAEILRVD
jgi:hypothetical protein